MRWADTWNIWWGEGVRVLAVETWDEELVMREARQLSDVRDVPLWRWSRVSGLVRAGETLSGLLTREPETFLDKVVDMSAGVVLAFDLWEEPLSPQMLRAIREIAGRNAPVMLLATCRWGMALPPVLERSVVKVTVGDVWGPNFHRWLNGGDEKLASQIRRQNVEMPGLDVVTGMVDWTQVGGLEGLKRWAQRRRLALRTSRGLPFPRGVLLYGIPGTGKSLSVKAWANDWKIPLLRLSWGGLMGRYVGQSESRLEAALKTAEQLAPAIYGWTRLIKRWALGVPRKMGALAGVWRECC